MINCIPKLIPLHCQWKKLRLNTLVDTTVCRQLITLMPVESLSAFQSIWGGIKHLLLNNECSQLPVYRNLIPELWATETPAGGHAGPFSGKEGGNQWKYFRYLK